MKLQTLCCIHMTEEALIENMLGDKLKAPSTITFTVHAFLYRLI